VTVETKQVYVPMEEWNIDEARKRHEAQWLSEGCGGPTWCRCRGSPCTSLRWSATKAERRPLMIAAIYARKSNDQNIADEERAGSSRA
jgi:hypothetical protein